MHTEGPGIWRESLKSRNMRNTHFSTWNMARKTEKVGKFRNVHCRMWNMARKLKIMENEKHPLDDLKNDEITEKREKWEIHTVGPGLWWGKLKKVENLEMSTIGHGYARELKIIKNEKHPLDDLRNGEIAEKVEK